MLAAADPREGRPVFVVSTGRCGSTLLSNILRLHPSILSISEFFSMLGGSRVLGTDIVSGTAFWALLSQSDPDLLGVLRRADVPEVLAHPAEAQAGLAGFAPVSLVTVPHLTTSPGELLDAMRRQVLLHSAAPARVHIARLFEWLRSRFGRSVWVERSGGSLEYAKLLREQWPDAKFVVLLRDGHDTARSMARHPMFRVRLARILAGCHTLPVEECLRADIALDRFGAYWSALMNKARRLVLSLAPRDVLIIQYEALVQSPAAVLRSLVEFITAEHVGQDWLDEACALIAQPVGRSLDLPRAQREALENACRPGARYVRGLLSNQLGVRAL